MNNRLVGYHAGTSFLHRLSGASKLLFLLLVSLAAMLSYDTRLLLVIGLGALALFATSGIRLKDISFVLSFALAFALLHPIVLLDGLGAYSITAQELFYLFNLALKYVCTIPLALIFLMTTHPSQFASSLNQIGVSYKIAYSVSLTLRYIPDVQEEYQIIKLSQEARGLELSKKANFVQRVKGNLQMISPLIFSSLERIETISTAMELRRFGKNKKRTWYTYQEMTTRDRLIILGSIFMVVLSLVLIWVNKGRFYNPWR